MTSTGPATLVAFVGGQSVDLGVIDIEGTPHQMVPPTNIDPLDAVFGGSVKLVGYRLSAPDPLTSDDTVLLTLFWQALMDGAPGANYKVFTQMLGADGRLVGQHDGLPASETRPFSSWVVGEYITDGHPMTFYETYSGMIHIQVGLYDPVTLRRVLLADGKDSVVLPLGLQVESKR
jgi:hypothetical protein